MKGIEVEISSPDWKGDLREYLPWLAQKDRRLFRTLKSSGIPSRGECCLLTAPGKSYGTRFNELEVNSLAVLVGKFDDAALKKMGGILCVSESEVDDSKIWRIWLLEIGHIDKNRGSCIRYLWDRHSNGAHISIEHINNDLARAERGQRPRTSVIAQLRYLISGLEIIDLESTRLKREGRPEGTGWFKTTKDFRTALKEVLGAQKHRPTQLKVLKLLDDHQLSQLKPAKKRTQSHTKLLRDWLEKARIRSYSKALSLYWKPPKSGK